MGGPKMGGPTMGGPNKMDGASGATKPPPKAAEKPCEGSGTPCTPAECESGPIVAALAAAAGSQNQLQRLVGCTQCGVKPCLEAKKGPPPKKGPPKKGPPKKGPPKKGPPKKKEL